jgi:hypothetical protein
MELVGILIGHLYFFLMFKVSCSRNEWDGDTVYYCKICLISSTRKILVVPPCSPPRIFSTPGFLIDEGE